MWRSTAGLRRKWAGSVVHCYGSGSARMMAAPCSAKPFCRDWPQLVSDSPDKNLECRWGASCHADMKVVLKTQLARKRVMAEPSPLKAQTKSQS